MGRRNREHAIKARLATRLQPPKSCG
jgi:hypothetical protein